MLCFLSFRCKNLLLFCRFSQRLTLSLLLSCNFNRFFLSFSLNFCSGFLFFLSFLLSLFLSFLLQSLFSLFNVLSIGILRFLLDNSWIDWRFLLFIYLLNMFHNFLSLFSWFLLRWWFFNLCFDILSWSIFSSWVSWELVWILSFSVIHSPPLRMWLFLN